MDRSIELGKEAQKTDLINADVLLQYCASNGFPAPVADILDIRQAALGLSRSVSKASAGLGINEIDVPFQEVLLKYASEPLGPTSQTSRHERQLPEGIAGSEQWVRDSLEKIANVAPGKLAWHDIYADEALQDAIRADKETSEGKSASALHGIPVGVKDMFDQTGKRAGWGGTLRQSEAVATQEATMITRLKQAGALILGTQHMAEFAMSPTGLNATYGPGQNPWNTAHVSGGSSSGAGMSVGAGHVPLALGSDTGGSVRLPAALCGVVGLKATQYRTSLHGVMPLSPNLDGVGPLAQTVRLVGEAYAAIAGPDGVDLSCLPVKPNLPDWDTPNTNMTIAYPVLEAGSLLTEEMLNAFKATLATFKEMGFTLVKTKLPDLDLLGQLASVMLAAESAAVHRHWLMTQPEKYGRQVRRRLSRGFFVSGMDYYDALRLRPTFLKRFLEESMPGADAFLLPTTPGEAPKITDTIGSDETILEKRFSALSYWTRGINYLGVPGISFPAGRGAQGLPLGVQLIGRPLGEDRILSMAHQFEMQTGWPKK